MQKNLWTKLMEHQFVCDDLDSCLYRLTHMLICFIAVYKFSLIINLKLCIDFLGKPNRANNILKGEMDS